MKWTYLKAYLEGGAGEADRFLCEVWRPALDTVVGDNALHFFLRYTDDSGPHLRLRVQGIDLAGRLLAHMEIRLAAADDFGPVRFVSAKYIPETEKYGGVDGIALSERQFHHASVFAFDVLAATPGAMARRILLAALELHWIGGQIAPDVDERKQLFEQYQTFWQAYYGRLVGMPLAPADPIDALEATAKELGGGNIFAQALGILEAHIAWRSAVTKNLASLIDLCKQRQLSAPAALIALNWGHTLCNRFGVTLRGELAVTAILSGGALE